MRQFIACKFRPTDTRSFTYHYDGEETFVPGDEVKVSDRSGDGWKRVYVVEVGDEAPAFETKGVIGRYERPEEDAAATDAGQAELPA